MAAGAGDTGPNTGGMGALSPVPFAGREFMLRVYQEAVSKQYRFFSFGDAMFIYGK